MAQKRITAVQGDDGVYREVTPIEPEVTTDEPNQTPKEPQGRRSNAIDFSLLREFGDEDSESVFDCTRSLAENYSAALKECVGIHNEKVQLPLMTAFALLPSALLRIAPIGLAVGSAGSGKSTYGQTVARLHAVNVLSANSTYAAIRNSLNGSRWLDDDMTLERHTFLVFDDCKEHHFGDDLFTMFRCGYDRATERVEMSSEIPGQNKVFYTFAPKIFSTTSNFPFTSKFEELLRRSFVFYFKRLEKSSDRDFLDPSDINWQPFIEQFDKHWNDIGNGKQFISFHKSQRKRPKGFSPTQWVISRPLLTSLVCNEIAKDASEGIDLLRTYWSELIAPESSLTAILKQEIADAKGVYLNNLDVAGEYFEFEIPCETITKRLQMARAKGELDRPATDTAISEEMASLGYIRKPGTDKSTMVWKQINA